MHSREEEQDEAEAKRTELYRSRRPQLPQAEAETGFTPFWYFTFHTNKMILFRNMTLPDLYRKYTLALVLFHAMTPHYFHSSSSSISTSTPSLQAHLPSTLTYLNLPLTVH